MAKEGFKVFDSDMHIMEPPDLWQRFTDDEFRDQAPIGVTSENVRDLGTVHPSGTQWGSLTLGPRPSPSRIRGHNYDKNQLLYADHASRGWGPDCQIEAMNTEGIDTATLFPTRGLHTLAEPNMDPRLARALARAYNDWLADFCSYAPDRLIGAAMISPFDMNDAVEEVERTVNHLGMRAVFIRSNLMNDIPWHDHYYDPLWDTLEKHDIPIGFHEASSSGARQSGQQFASNLMLRRVYAQPFEQMMAFGAFTGGGVLERHPGLRAAFLEANCSWLPWLLWRLDEGYERESDAFSPELKMAPSEYFHRQVWVSVEPDEAPALDAISRYGSDNLVFSTDYPHGDSKYPVAVSSFLELQLEDDHKRKILWDNCAKFYNVQNNVVAG
jgi:predicted TIM-barrel fold metal-dependent hydrolase